MTQSGFVDDVQVNLRGGDGGAGAVVVPARGARARRAGPTAATAGPGGDVSCRPTATSRRCSRSATIRTAGPSRGRTAAGNKRHGARGRRPRRRRCPRARR